MILSRFGFEAIILPELGQPGAIGLFCMSTQEERRYPAITYCASPLIEVGISVQFDSPKGLNQAHLGAFWATQKAILPQVRSVQAIGTTNEVFGTHGQWLPPSLQFAVTSDPDCRLQMNSSDDQWMLQVQRNRFVINWRKRNDPYPRFQTMWTRFQSSWQVWLKFLTDLGLEPLTPRLWELTYVNRIQRENLWESPKDWPRVFPGLWPGDFAVVGGAELRGFGGQWVWESSVPPARLYVEPRPGRTGQPPQDVLLLSLTARGRVDTPNAENPVSVECGVNWGHKMIVETFDRITSDLAKKTWERDANGN